MQKMVFIFCCVLYGFLQINAQQAFYDIAPSMGITTSYGVGYAGGGISFCDFNGDGLDDLTFATDDGMACRFFQNMGGTLVEIPPLVLNFDEIKQILWADYDNDGDKDLFLCTYGGFNRLYQNDGNMNMTDVTIAAGIPSTNLFHFGAAFGDYDNDGWLDLYLCVRGSTNVMLHNNQDGTFSDVTNSLMVGNVQAASHNAVFMDYNKDLLPDLYLIEDKMTSNVMYRNDGGTFTDVSTISNTGIIMDAMNAGVGDYDNDGDLDIYITNTKPGSGSIGVEEGNVLYQNNNDGTFTNIAAGLGLEINELSWGGNWLDWDNDMDLDLYVCLSSPTLDRHNRLFENQGNGAFIDFLPNGLPGDTTLSFCNAIGDIKDNGQIDIAVSTIGGFPFMVWENDITNTHNWLKIALEGVQSNRDGIGVWIEVETGADTQYKYTLCGEAFIAQNTNNHHFGLASNTLVDKITIKWPSGNVDILEDIAVNQKIKIKEGQGQILPTVECANKLHIALPSDNSTYNAHQILTSDATILITFMVQYEAGDCIELQTGFEVELGAEFSVEIAPCQ